MTIRALANLEARRRAGHKPAADVWVWLDSWPEWSDGESDVHVAQADSTVRIDLRPLVGCTAVLFVDSITPRSASLLDRLKPLCARVDVVIAAWLDRGEIGFRVERDGEPQDFPIEDLH